MRIWGVQLCPSMRTVVNQRWVVLTDDVQPGDLAIRTMLDGLDEPRKALVLMNSGTVVELEMFAHGTAVYSTSAYVAERPWQLMTYLGGGDSDGEGHVFRDWQDMAEVASGRRLGEVFSQLRAIRQRPLLISHFSPPEEASIQLVEEVRSLVLACCHQWHLMRMEDAPTL